MKLEEKAGSILSDLFLVHIRTNFAETHELFMVTASFFATLTSIFFVVPGLVAV